MFAWTAILGSPFVPTGCNDSGATVDPEQLDEVAADLWRDERLREMPPEAAAIAWLGPLLQEPF